MDVVLTTPIVDGNGPSSLNDPARKTLYAFTPGGSLPWKDTDRSGASGLSSAINFSTSFNDFKGDPTALHMARLCLVPTHTASGVM